MSNFKKLPIAQRPREKALQRGIQSLSDYELLALILKTGNKELSVIEFATYLLINNNGLFNFFSQPFNKLCLEKGINKAKALEIQAIYEVCKRMNLYRDYEKKIAIKTHQEVYQRVYLDLQKETQEKFMCLYLNLKNIIVKEEILFVGTETYACVDAKIIVKNALNCGAQKIYILHNHPSGDPTPSQSDIDLTKTIYMCTKLFQMELIEHLIIGKSKYFAILEKKLYII